MREKLSNGRFYFNSSELLFLMLASKFYSGWLSNLPIDYSRSLKTVIIRSNQY